MSALAEAEVNGEVVTEQRVQPSAHLRWVPVAQTRVPPTGQREFVPAKAAEFAADFDPDKLGYPVVNLRDGVYWIVDGQHRIAAMKQIGWGDQQIQCECFVGLSDAKASEIFLGRNNRIAVKALDKFTVSIAAERERECDIDRVVRLQGLRVGVGGAGSITAVAALGKIYDKGGGVILGRALRIIRDAFGDAGLHAQAIEGIGLVCFRYQADLDEGRATLKLGAVMAGINGLMNRAAVLRKQTGRTVAHCVAAAAVEIINSGKGGHKLADWWRADAEDGQ